MASRRKKEETTDIGESAQDGANRDRHTVAAHHELWQINHHARGSRERFGSNRRSLWTNDVERARRKVVRDSTLERDTGVARAERHHRGFGRIYWVFEVLEQVGEAVGRG